MAMSYTSANSNWFRVRDINTFERRYLSTTRKSKSSTMKIALKTTALH